MKNNLSLYIYIYLLKTHHHCHLKIQNYAPFQKYKKKIFVMVISKGADCAVAEIVKGNNGKVERAA